MNDLKNIDETMFVKLYDEYFTRLCRHAEMYIKCRATAEDIVEALFAKLWENREKITITASPKSYLHASIRNSCFKYIKHSTIERKYLEFYSFDSYDDYNPYSVLITKETDNIMKNTLDVLPCSCRQIFEMWFIKGLKYHEIASIRNISIGTVKAQLYRAKVVLKKSLDK